MATQNFFALLGDEESDASAVIDRAAAADKPIAKKHQHSPPVALHPAPAKLPSKPLPPAQALKESKFYQFDSGRGRGGRVGGRGSYDNRFREREGGFDRPVRDGSSQGDRGSYGDRNYSNNRDANDFQRGRGGYYGRSGAASYGGYGNGTSPGADADGGLKFEGGRGRGRGRAGGGGRGYGDGTEGVPRGYGDGLDGEPYQLTGDYERTGRGNGFKRDSTKGANFGTSADHSALWDLSDAKTTEEEKHGNEVVENQPAEETKADTGIVEEKKDEEGDNEMLLDDYYKALDKKKKPLEYLKTEERKVILDKEFERMKLVDKKQNEGTFVKPGSDKDKGKKKEITDREEKTKKSVSINEFLRPSEGEDYYTPASRRRGRGRGDRGGYRGGFVGSYNTALYDLAPRIEDPGQFPTLGVK